MFWSKREIQKKEVSKFRSFFTYFGTIYVKNFPHGDVPKLLIRR
jgi:hypothetical protein